MNVFTILTDALRSIPAPVRKTLLIVFALLVAGEFVAEEILGYDTGKADEILLYVGGYLGVQSAANVKPKDEPKQGTAVNMTVNAAGNPRGHNIGAPVTTDDIRVQGEPYAPDDPHRY